MCGYARSDCIDYDIDYCVLEKDKVQYLVVLYMTSFDYCRRFFFLESRNRNRQRNRNRFLVMID